MIGKIIGIVFTDSIYLYDFTLIQSQFYSNLDIS
jgi:hypothetical protein